MGAAQKLRNRPIANSKIRQVPCGVVQVFGTRAEMTAAVSDQAGLLVERQVRAIA